MTGTDLQQWRARMGLNVKAAAEKLGVDPDTYSRLERRELLDTRTALACAALAYGLKPMGEKPWTMPPWTPASN